MKKFLSLLMCILMITTMSDFSSLVNAVTTIELPQSTADEADATSAKNDKSSEENSEEDTDDSESGLVDKKITGYYNGHVVEVSGMLPKVATLSLTSVDENTAQQLVAEKRTDGRAIFACDIKILDADGKQWQPEDEKTVEINVSGIENDKKEVQFLHIAEDVDEVLSQENPAESIKTITDVTVKDGKATFPTDGFSTFVGFTVDFHYNGKSYSMQGKSETTLSNVFEKLGIDKDVADVVAVDFTDPSLVKFEQIDGDWKITSLEAFGTEERLTVTFKDGEVMEINVTDYTEYSITIGYGSYAKQATAGLTVTGSSTDSNRDTVDGYTFSGGVSSGNHLTINLAGNIRHDADVAYGLYVKDGGKLTINNTRSDSKDVYFFAGDLDQSDDGLAACVSVANKAALDINHGGSTSKRVIFDGRKATNKGALPTTFVNESASDGGDRRDSRLIACGTSDASSTTNDIDIRYAVLQNNITGDADNLRGGGLYIHNKRNSVNVSHTSFYNLTTTDTTCSLYGMGIRFMSTFESSNVTISNCSFWDCEIPYDTNGTAICFAGDYTGTMQVKNCYFRSCKASQSAGAILFGSSAKVTGTNGFELLYDDGLQNTVVVEGINDDGTVLDRTGVKSGFYACNGSTTAETAKGACITVETTAAGAINYLTVHVTPGDYIDDVDIFNNCETYESGAISLVGGGTAGTVYVTNFILDYGPTKPSAGTVVTTDGADYDADARNGTADPRKRAGSFFKDCHAIKRGGAMLFETGTTKTIIDGAIFESCYATDGGCMMFEGDSKNTNFKIYDSVFKKNSSITRLTDKKRYGGACIRATGSANTVLTLEDCTFEENKANWAGGGIYWSASKGSSECTVKKCMFDGNQAVYSGGAINNEATLTIANSVVRNNTALIMGGGIRNTVYYQTANSDWKLTVTSLSIGSGCEIYSNKAGLFGGGIIAQVRWSGNVHYNYKNTSGYTFTYKCDISDGAKIHDNIAGACGGGIYYGLGWDENLTSSNGWDSYLDKDTTTKDVSSYSSSNLTGGTIPSLVNRQKILNRMTKEINITGGEIYNNIAGYDGGGVYSNLYYTNVNMTGGNIYGNRAGIDNIQMEFLNCSKGSATSFDITGKSETWLQSAQNEISSGVYFDTRRMDTNASVAGFGGGICVKGIGSVFNMTGGYIGKEKSGATPGVPAQVHEYGNKADFGGGIAVKDATFTFSGGNVEYNMAYSGGGVYTMGSGTVEISNGNINKNHADGQRTILTHDAPTDTTYTVATVGGTGISKFLATERTSTIRGAIRKGSGGGVNAHAGTVTVTGGNIQYNTATNGAGGGVWVDDGGDVNMTGGKLIGNIAEYTSAPSGNTTLNEEAINGVGGAVGVGNGVEGNTSTYSLEISPADTAIYDNEAEFAADDVYSSGTYTQLTIPNTGEMDIPNENNLRQKIGWFEDFHTGDSNYNAANSISSATSTSVVERYRVASASNNTTKMFQIYKTGSANTGAKTYVNAANAYVNMTLGIVESGGLKIGKTVRTPSNSENNTNVSDWNTFQINLGSGAIAPVITGVFKMNSSNAMTGGTQVLAAQSAGATVNTDYFKTVSTGSPYEFQMKNGYYVGFDARGTYTVSETDKNNRVTNTYYKTKDGNGAYSGETSGTTTGNLVVSNDAPKEVEFINKYSLPGDITITKRLQDANGTDLAAGIETFTFNISGTPADIGAITLNKAAVKRISDDASVSETEAGFTVNSASTSNYRFTLKNGYYVQIQANGTYYVEEVLTNQQTTVGVSSTKWRVGTSGDYTVGKKSGDMAVAWGTNPKVEFINTRRATGTFSVGKNLISNKGVNLNQHNDYNNEWYTFKIVYTADTADAPLPANFYKINADSSTTSVSNTGFFEQQSSSATEYIFRIKTGYSVTFSGRGSYTVEETGKGTDVIETSYTLDSTQGIGSKTPSFFVDGSNSHTVLFTNKQYKAGTLTVGKNAKNANGDYIDSTLTETYRFKLTYTADTDIPVLAAVYAMNGNAISGGTPTDSTTAGYSVVTAATSTVFEFKIKAGYYAVFTTKGTYGVEEVYTGTQADNTATSYKYNNGTETTGKIVENIYVDSLNSNTVEFINVIYTLGSITIGKNVRNADNTNLNNTYSDMYQFTISGKGSSNITLSGVYKMNNNTMSGGSIIDNPDTSIYSVVSNNGSTSYSFKIKNGYYAVFSACGNYNITENLTADQTNHVVSTHYKHNSGSETLGTTTDTYFVDKQNNRVFEFINTVVYINITIKYYGRKIVNGLPSDINDTPNTVTTYVVGKDIIGNNTDYSDRLYVLSMYAVNKAKATITDNVLDSYKTYTSTDVNHLNNYGQDSGERWLQWFDDGTEVSTFNESTVKNITHGTIWLKNTPKRYSVYGYCAETATPLEGTLTRSSVGGVDYYTCNKASVGMVAYYNQRIGVESSNDEPDKATEHLKAYNKSGYTGSEITSQKTITYDNKQLIFSHWSLESNGQTIASTDLKFTQRVTKNLNIYAVYTTSPKTERGLIVDGNNPDEYTVNSNAKVRLNTIVSAYNFNDDDANNYFKNLSGIYVIPDSSLTIESKHVTALQSWILEQLESREGSDGTVEAGLLKLKVGEDDIAKYPNLSGLKGGNFVVYNESTNYTNKNRVNMTAEFSKTTTANQRMLAFAAINYQLPGMDSPYWRVSDNCILYEFDSNGSVKHTETDGKRTYTGITSIFES